MNSLYQKLRGTGVALVTPFTTENLIDFEGLKRLINHVIEGGVEYLVVLGTTGESVTLSKTEKHQILEFVVQENKGRVPIVAGFGGNNTQHILDEMAAFHFNGIDAILSVAPYYNKPTQAGYEAHFKMLAKASPKPIILYNVPGRTGSNMTAETTINLSKVENIIGIKEASGNFGQCMQIAKNTPTDFLKISGDDNLTLSLIALGFDGVISVSGQGFPTQFSGLVRAALAGDFNTAKQLHYALLDITDMLFAEGNPGGIKYVLQKKGILSESMRLPLVPISAHLKAQIESEMIKYNL